MSMRHVLLIGGVSAFLLAVVNGARADGPELTLCNKTGDTVSFSVAGFDRDVDRMQYRSEGWWNVDAGDCKELTLGNLRKRHLFVYAEGGGGYWKGDYVFCIHPEDSFDLKGDYDCKSRGIDHTARGFIHRTNPFGIYTLDLTE